MRERLRQSPGRPHASSTNKRLVREDRKAKTAARRTAICSSDRAVNCLQKTVGVTSAVAGLLSAAAALILAVKPPATHTAAASPPNPSAQSASPATREGECRKHPSRITPFSDVETTSINEERLIAPREPLVRSESCEGPWWHGHGEPMKRHYRVNLRPESAG